MLHLLIQGDSDEMKRTVDLRSIKYESEAFHFKSFNINHRNINQSVCFNSGFNVGHQKQKQTSAKMAEQSSPV